MNIEDLIAQANPVPRASLPAPDSPQARQVLAQVTTELAGDRHQPWHSSAGSRVRPAARIRRRVAVGIVAAAGAAAVVLTQVLPGSPAKPRHAGHQSHRVSALDALALVAAAQPLVQPLKPGQFQYTDSKALTIDDTYFSTKIHFSVSYRAHRRIWIGANGSGRLAETFTDPRFLSPQDRAQWILAGRPSLKVRPSDQRFGPHQLTLGPRNLLKLPTDPAKLYALLVARKIEGGPPGPAEDFVQIGDLLRETDAPPALRAAIFKVARWIPGVRLLGTVKDHAGRSGVGIAYFSHFRATHGRPAESGESELIFDPKTSKLLAEQQLVTSDKTKRTTYAAWTVYLVSGVVNSITSTTPVSGTASTGSGPA